MSNEIRNACPELYNLISSVVYLIPDIRNFNSKEALASLTLWSIEVAWDYIAEEVNIIASLSEDSSIDILNHSLTGKYDSESIPNCNDYKVFKESFRCLYWCLLHTSIDFLAVILKESIITLDYIYSENIITTSTQWTSLVGHLDNWALIDYIWTHERFYSLESHKIETLYKQGIAQLNAACIAYIKPHNLLNIVMKHITNITFCQRLIYYMSESEKYLLLKKIEILNTPLLINIIGNSRKLALYAMCGLIKNNLRELLRVIVNYISENKIFYNQAWPPAAITGSLTYLAYNTSTPNEDIISLIDILSPHLDENALITADSIGSPHFMTIYIAKTLQEQGKISPRLSKSFFSRNISFSTPSL